MGLLDSLLGAVSGDQNTNNPNVVPVSDVNPDTMRAIAQIESGGNPNATTGSYKGLYQLSDSEFKRYGGQGSIYDPAENARIAGLKLADESNQVAAKLGRPLTPAEQYLVHQQGVGGALAHLQNPDQPAWQSMASTAEGRQKGPGWAKQAIWGNIPDASKAQFGNVDNVTSGQFANLWAQRFGRAMGQPDVAAPVQHVARIAPVNSPAPANSPLAIPSQQAPVFPQGAPAQQFGGGGSQPSLMAQLQPPAPPPIQYYQRRPINLSALQGQLRPPILSQG